MSNEISRRNFLKTAGATAAGVAVATAYNPRSYAQNEKVRVASIGTGGQGCFHLVYGLGPAENIQMVAVCDVFRKNQEAGWKNAGGEEGDVKRYADYHEMLEKEELDAVVIATPLNTHYQIALDCLDAGVNIFLEKTICYTIEDCRDIVKKVHETGKICQVGHQRRYNPFYNKAMWLAHDKQMLGRINHITAQWHRNNDWRRPVPSDYVLSETEKKWITDLERHVNWRLYTKSSGGLMTELATHQLDVANWFLGVPPKKVYGYGGIDYWRDGREVFDNVVLVYEYEVDRSDTSFQAIVRRNDYQKLSQINRPYTVRMTYSSICSNAKRGASELIQGDLASVELTEMAGCNMFGERATKPAEKKKDDKASDDATDVIDTRLLPNEAYNEGTPILVVNDKNVDQLQMEAFAEDIKAGTTPKANEMVGLYTAVAGLAGLQALREGVEVEIKPEWYAFDFETPDPNRYEFWPEPGREDQTAETA